MKQISEGSVSYTVPEVGVFFNPTQVFNRDMSVAVISNFISLFRRELTDKYERIQRLHPDATGVQGERGAAVQQPAGSDAMPKVSDPPGPQRPIPSSTDPVDTSTHLFRILDALSASGLRALRYSRELDPSNQYWVVANDIKESAVREIKKNHAQNPPAPCCAKFEVRASDCNLLMQEAMRDGQYFDVVDLDPYGSPMPFADSAILALRNGGLLAASATDLRLLCGGQDDECVVRYNASPATAKSWCHEGAIRIVLGSLAVAAARSKAVIQPLLSFFHAHYLRVFVRVWKQYKGPLSSRCKNLSQVFFCPTCELYEERNLLNRVLDISGVVCPFCGSRYRVAGPMWTGPIHDDAFLSAFKVDIPGSGAVLKTASQLHAHIAYAAAENSLPPLVYSVPVLSKCFRMHTPQTVAIASALESLGFTVGPAHTLPGGLKTTAPRKAVLSVMYVFYCLYRVALERRGPPGREAKRRPPTQQEAGEPEVANSQVGEETGDDHLLMSVSDSPPPLSTRQERRASPRVFSDAVLDSLPKYRLHGEQLMHFYSRYYRGTPDDGVLQSFKQFYGDYDAFGPEVPILDFCFEGGQSLKWFVRQTKAEDGNYTKRVPQFLPNPEKAWGPKKMQ